MLARMHRLADRRTIDAIRARGRRYQGRYVALRVLPRPDAPTRIAVVMSTKAAKRAVIRNRHKRIIRAELANLLADKGTGWDAMIIVVRPTRKPEEEVELREDVRQVFAHLS